MNYQNRCSRPDKILEAPNTKMRSEIQFLRCDEGTILVPVLVAKSITGLKVWSDDTISELLPGKHSENSETLIDPVIR